MCIIIDTNRISDVISKSEHAVPVLEWLKKPDSHVAIGGTKLNDEYKKIKAFVKLLAALDSAGRIRRFNGDLVDAAHRTFEASGLMKSDDPHILGLAHVSNCRLLYSDDENLHADFTNVSILKPKGKIYQYYSHSHLLKNSTKCAK